MREEEGYPLDCINCCEFYQVKPDGTNKTDWVETCKKGIPPEHAFNCGEIVKDRRLRQ